MKVRDALVAAADDQAVVQAVMSPALYDTLLEQLRGSIIECQTVLNSAVGRSNSNKESNDKDDRTIDNEDGQETEATASEGSGSEEDD